MKKRVSIFIDKIFEMLFSERYRRLVFVLSLALIYFLFLRAFDDLITKFFVPVLSNCLSDVKNDVIFGLLFSLTILYLFWKINCGKLSPSKSGITISIILLLIYFPHRVHLFSWQNWEPTSFFFTKAIKYSDVVFLFIIMTTLSFSKRWINVPCKNEKSFFEDNHSTFGNIDLLKRERLVNEIAEFISGTTPSNSFAVGIMGKWGSGKTVFLSTLEKKLDNNFIKVKFNPWRSKDSKQILEDFFSSLINELKNYDPNLSRQIEKYSKTLLSVDNGVFTKILKPIHQLIYPDIPLQIQYESIKKSIETFKFKVIIFIDDLDRLDSDEILEVLRIIRNTVDFPNTFFLVAYEQNYILRSIKKSKIPKVDRYLEKIFQIEITLPSYPDLIIRDNLFELLKKNRSVDEYKEIENAITLLSNLLSNNEEEFSSFKSSNLIKDHIENLRDVVRLVNSFNLNYNFKKDEVDLIDFLIVELIKLKYYFVYLSIMEQLTTSNDWIYFITEGGFLEANRKIKFDIDKFRIFWNQEWPGKSTNELDKIIKTTNYLFNRERKDLNLRSIILPENIFIYFSYELFDKISFREFKSARKGPLPDFIKTIDRWLVENKQIEVANIFIKTINFESKEDFENFIRAMLYLNKLNRPNWHMDIFTKLNNVDFIVRQYYQGKIELYKRFLMRLFGKAKYPFILESSIAFAFLYPFLNNDLSNKALFTIDELNKILLKFLKTYCESEESTDITIDSFKLYYNNQLSINMQDRRVIISTKANEVFRKFIEKNPESYITELIRPLYTPHDGKTFTLEPFIPQTFGSYQAFESFLKKIKNTQVVLELKTFYYRFKNNGHKPIEFERGVIKFYSNEDTEFIESQKYPHLKYQKNVKCFEHPYNKNILSIPDLYDFRNANWICHDYPIDEIQATNGGDYLLKFQFKIEEPSKNVIGRIRLFVDDICDLIVNKKIIDSNIETGNLNQKLDIEINYFETTFPVKNGNNSISFKIKNKSSIEIKHPPQKIITGKENPYGIIFIIKLIYY